MVEPPGTLESLVDPAAADLLPMILDWFEAIAADRSCVAMEGDRALRAVLERRGYHADEGGPYFRRHIHDLADLPAVPLPDGFTITRVTAADAERRAAVHRAGWSDFGSRVTVAHYRRVMAAYPYRPETDLVVVSPAGDWVASALGWYDEVNRVGLVEPVSCAPGFRRRGLATAVNIALLHAFRVLGATSAVILPRGDPAYPAPQRLYRAIGYRPGPRTVRYS
jgi:hypothetical protein